MHLSDIKLRTNLLNCLNEMHSAGHIFIFISIYVFIYISEFFLEGKNMYIINKQNSTKGTEDNRY